MLNLLEIFDTIFLNQLFCITFSFIISFLIGFWKEISSIFSIKRTFSFYPYFLLGYKFPKKYLEKIVEFKKKYYFTILLLIIPIIYIALNQMIFIEVNHSMMTSDYQHYKEDILFRLKLFIFSFLFIIINILAVPNRFICLLTKIGKYSLYIYLFHRILTIIVDYELFLKTKKEFNIILYSLVFSLIIIIIFGSDYFAKTTNAFINYIYDNLYKMNFTGKIIGLIFYFLFIGILSIKPKILINKLKK